MDLLWTPWRYSYITAEKPKGRRGVPDELSAWPGPDPGTDQDCVFCNLIRSVDWAATAGFSPGDADRAGLILARTEHSYLCLNRFPYASGHVLIVPRRHTDALMHLPPAEATDVMLQAQRVERALRHVYRPDGINLGMNLGQAAGAGVADHLHLHILPRWVGDTNFMTVTAETRVLPEMLGQTWERLRDALATL